MTKIKTITGRVLRKPESATNEDIKLLCQAILERDKIEPWMIYRGPTQEFWDEWDKSPTKWIAKHLLQSSPTQQSPVTDY